MIVKNVPIKGLDHQVGNDFIVMEAMSKLTIQDNVWIYCVGSCTEKKALDEPCEIPRPIGIASNIHKDSEGNYICDCDINMYMELAMHFDGVIDGVSIMLDWLDDVPNDRYAIKVPRNVAMNPKVCWFVINEKEIKEESSWKLKTY